MADYKKMYLTLFQATEDAINRLTEAQKECEELYISSPEPELTLLESSNYQSPTSHEEPSPYQGEKP